MVHKVYLCLPNLGAIDMNQKESRLDRQRTPLQMKCVDIKGLKKLYGT